MRRMKCAYCGMEIIEEEDLVWIRFGEGLRLPFHRHCYNLWVGYDESAENEGGI